MLGSLLNCELDKGGLSYLSFIPIHSVTNVSLVLLCLLCPRQSRAENVVMHKRVPLFHGVTTWS